jgi:hypothetical protein
MQYSQLSETSRSAFQHPLLQRANTPQRIRAFFTVTFIALSGWVVAQTLFSLSPFGQSHPFVALAIEFTWWLALLLVLFLIFKRATGRLTFCTHNLEIVERKLEEANGQITQKNMLLEQSIKDVWTARKRFLLPANVVATGHYQIQDLFGGYHDVYVRNRPGNHYLVCGCYVYQKEQICPHTIAAASLHLRMYSIFRQQSAGHHQERHPAWQPPRLVRYQGA